MKTISVRDLQRKIKTCVDASQADQVVLTRNGSPSAILFGVEGIDWESLVLETNKNFWRVIKKARKQKTIPLSEVKKSLGL